MRRRGGSVGIRGGLGLVLVVAAVCLAQQGGPGQSAEGRIRSDVMYLASDKLEGRRTGTEGANEAAAYIATEFKRLGLKPGGVRGRIPHGNERLKTAAYMQQFPFVSGVELGKGCEMLIGPGIPAEEIARLAVATMDGSSRRVMIKAMRAKSKELRAGEDWLPLGFSSNGLIEFQDAVFVGYGITSADLKHDDYEKTDVKRKVAIAIEGTPDSENPHSEFARFADVRWKAIAARDHGATALVIIAREENFKDDPLSRLRYDNSSGEAGIITVAISRQAAKRLFTQGGLAPLDDIQVLLAVPNSTSQPRSVMGQESRTEIAPASLQKGASAPLNNVTLTIGTNVVRKNSPSANVIGVLEGSDANLKSEVVVIGAHYDHLGRGGEGSLAPREGEIHHGADDNASGVAGLLELARIFSAERSSLKRSIVFVAFSGEEEGLIGSNYYVNQPTFPLEKTVAMINMDMIGRMKDRKLTIGGVGTAKEWKDYIKVANEGRVQRGDIDGLAGPAFVLALNEDGFGPSDHSSFYAKKVPVLFFFTGSHEDYHKPSDTADKIDYADEAKVISMVASLVRTISDEVTRPTYMLAKSESAGRSAGFRVYLGTIPNYADSTNGLTLDGVREDSPAAKAGLKAGDRIVKLAGREVKNVYDYTYALGEMKANVEYDVELVRGNEILKLKITPAARK
jgi:aminopeptidase YwaD